MSLKFPEDPQWIALITGIFFSTIGFTVYHFLNKSDFIKRVFSAREPDNNIRRIIFQRLSGVTIYGIIPMGIIFFTGGGGFLSGLTGTPNLSTLYFLIPFALVIIVLNYFNARSPGNLAMYPEIRKKEWTGSLVLLSALSWIVYLFAYEFLFRALLFIPALNMLGFWPAVVLNVGIYSLVHVPKSKQEGLGAIFLGFILCLLVIRTGSFWIAFFIHIFLALGNEWFSIRKNPEIKIIKA